MINEKIIREKIKEACNEFDSFMCGVDFGAFFRRLAGLVLLWHVLAVIFHTIGLGFISGIMLKVSLAVIFLCGITVMIGFAVFLILLSILLIFNIGFNDDK